MTRAALTRFALFFYGPSINTQRMPIDLATAMAFSGCHTSRDQQQTWTPQPKHSKHRDPESSGCGFGALRWCLCSFCCLLDAFMALSLSIYHCCITIMFRNRTFLYLIKSLCCELLGWRMRQFEGRRKLRDKSVGDGCGLCFSWLRTGLFSFSVHMWARRAAWRD